VGVDISGVIEVRPQATRPDLPHEIKWQAAVALDRLYDTRDYDAFGCLFGVKNFAGFHPIAANRGLPADASDHARRTFPEGFAHDGLWPTWVTWQEIQDVNWNEPALRADTRLRQYERNSGGQWVFRGKSVLPADQLDAYGIPRSTGEWSVGDAWTSGDVHYRAELMTRRSAIPASGNWQPVWDTMAEHAHQHGADNCRLVVWFDR
jgi:hypothetical protein